MPKKGFEAIPMVTEIEELGRIKLEISKLEDREKQLTEVLKAYMSAGEKISTDNFVAEKFIRSRRILDQIKVRAKLGQKKFLEVATVALKDLEKLIGKEDVDDCTENYKNEEVVTVKPVKK